MLRDYFKVYDIIEDSSEDYSEDYVRSQEGFFEDDFKEDVENYTEGDLKEYPEDNLEFKGSSKLKDYKKYFQCQHGIDPKFKYKSVTDLLADIENYKDDVCYARLYIFFYGVFNSILSKPVLTKNGFKALDFEEEFYGLIIDEIELQFIETLHYFEKKINLINHTIDEITGKIRMTILYNIQNNLREEFERQQRAMETVDFEEIKFNQDKKSKKNKYQILNDNVISIERHCEVIRQIREVEEFYLTLDGLERIILEKLLADDFLINSAPIPSFYTDEEIAVRFAVNKNTITTRRKKVKHKLLKSLQQLNSRMG